jgi:hypothetical protein
MKTKFVIPGERTFARGKGIQVVEDRRCFTTWIPFPSRPTGRSAGDDNR